MQNGKFGKHMESLNLYKGKKVFLTGHTGFKGSWMLRWLHSLGAEVKGYALKPENNFDLYHQINGDLYCESILDDIRNKARLEAEIKSFQPDFVFHFAAQPLVRLSYELPTETFEVNVMGTANVLEAVKSVSKHCVCVIITTDKVYENKEWHYPYRESDTLGGYDPYSASKAAAEIVVSSYRNSFFNNNSFSQHQKSVASARAGNVIGGGDWAKDRIIPDIVRALKKNEPISVRNPIAIRPWQHVLEPLSGYLRLAVLMYESPSTFDSAWNFGPLLDDNLTVEDIVKIAIESWGSGEYTTPKLDNQPHEASLLKLDISKAINELNWRPKLTAKEAIKWTIDFYKSTDANTFISQQIESYQSL
jgi:CDP-glucose 4,6-dehydratase